MKKTMSREVDLGNEPVRHLLLVLAVPAITSQVVNALYNMVDRMYIGHIPEVGSTALTGVGVCFPIIMIISAFAYLRQEPVSTWEKKTMTLPKRFWETVFRRWSLPPLF